MLAQRTEDSTLGTLLVTVLYERISPNAVLTAEMTFYFLQSFEGHKKTVEKD